MYEMGCNFDGQLVHGMFVSSGILKCETPGYDEQLWMIPVSISLAENIIANDYLELS